MTDPYAEDEYELTVADKLLQERRANVVEDIWKKVLDTWEGRYVIGSIIGKGDLYGLSGQRSHDVGPLNRAEGRREVAQEVLLDSLRVNPEVYILMQREAGEFEAQYLIKRTEQEGSDDG